MECAGVLYKWINVAKGWQSRWYGGLKGSVYDAVISTSVGVQVRAVAQRADVLQDPWKAQDPCGRGEAQAR